MTTISNKTFDQERLMGLSMEKVLSKKVKIFRLMTVSLISDIPFGMMTM